MSITRRKVIKVITHANLSVDGVYIRQEKYKNTEERAAEFNLEHIDAARSVIADIWIQLPRVNMRMSLKKMCDAYSNYMNVTSDMDNTITKGELAVALFICKFKCSYRSENKGRLCFHAKMTKKARSTLREHNFVC